MSDNSQEVQGDSATDRQSAYRLPQPLLDKVERLVKLKPNEVFSVWGTNLRCYYASPSTVSIKGGWTPREMIGRKASEFVFFRDWPHVALAKSDAELTGESVEMTVDVKNRFGERVRMRSRTVLLKEPGSLRVFFMTRSVPADQKLSDLED